MSGKIIQLAETKLPENCYVFKHSTRCPVSFAAADEVKAAEFALPLYWINVVEQRPFSNWFASEFSVEHASPQLILVQAGVAVRSWSHGEIKKDVFIK